MARSSLRGCFPVVLVVLLVQILITGAGHAQPENDDCSEAIPITDGTYQGTTVGASLDGATGCTGLCECYGQSGTAPDVWYLYTATCDGRLEVDICGSIFDTWLSIQEPGCSGAEVACNEDYCGPTGWQSWVSTQVAAGEQYLIRVSGWEGESGPFELHVSCTFQLIPEPRPSRDRCENAVSLEVPSATLGSTAQARGEPFFDVMGYPRVPGDWACWGSRRGIWYKVVGTGNRMIASVYPSSELGVIVYCDSCDQLTCVTGRGDDSPEVSWCTRAGQVYMIQVASGGDNFELQILDDGVTCFGAVDCTPVEVVDTFVVDNGDEDGWADTYETARLRFTVTNRSGTDMTGLVARLSSNDPKLACMAEPVVHVGNLAAGETRLVPGAFTFRVNDVDRAVAGKSEIAEFTASLNVSFSSDQFEDLSPRRCSLSGVECDDHGDCTYTDICADKTCWISSEPCMSNLDCAIDLGDYCVGRCTRSGLSCIDGISECENTFDFCVDESQELRVDLDLDVSGGSNQADFFEGFESATFGTFTEMNLDAVLHGPEAADGSRCHDRDPAKFGLMRDYAIWPGASQQHADAYYWQVDGGRSYSGLHSLYMGLEYSPGEFTTPIGAVEAIGMTEPINLDWARSCSISGDICLVDADCAPGENCLAVSPELSFKHQVSHVDSRIVDSWPHHAISSGVVQVAVVDAGGEIVVPWQTIDPKVNRYDSALTPQYFNPAFDPTDDGTTEDDMFAFFEADPPVGTIGGRYESAAGRYVAHADLYYLGPSSNCFPQPIFAVAGDTDDPFDPLNLNGPVEGPGLQGALGLGTWVEPVFSLDRYRGRRIRLRFLTTSLKMADAWETYWSWGLWGPSDDGWWIDDVTITHTLLEPATMTADTKDNSGLAFDADGDCVADDVDVMPGNDQVWALPGEVIDLSLSHTGGAGGTTTLRWGPASTMGATAVNYIVIADDGASCFESNVGPDRSAIDSITPPPGFVRQFLIQAQNGYGRGTLGTGSDHDPRDGCD